jgi:hypothetical protein
LEIRVVDVLETLNATDSETYVISGGNEPVKEKVDRKTKVSVPKNDGFVMIISL